MNFVFHPEAEFYGAIKHYESCATGVGDEFALEIYVTIQGILARPRAWPLLAPEVRRCLVSRFPFGVLYSIEPDRICILSVMHLHRKPEYWMQRK